MVGRLEMLGRSRRTAALALAAICLPGVAVAVPPPSGPAASLAAAAPPPVVVLPPPAVLAAVAPPPVLVAPSAGVLVAGPPVAVAPARPERPRTRVASRAAPRLLFRPPVAVPAAVAEPPLYADSYGPYGFSWPVWGGGPGFPGPRYRPRFPDEGGYPPPYGYPDRFRR